MRKRLQPGLRVENVEPLCIGGTQRRILWLRDHQQDMARAIHCSIPPFSQQASIWYCRRARIHTMTDRIPTLAVNRQKLTYRRFDFEIVQCFIRGLTNISQIGVSGHELTQLLNPNPRRLWGCVV